MYLALEAAKDRAILRVAVEASILEEAISCLIPAQLIVALEFNRIKPTPALPVLLPNCRRYIYVIVQFEVCLQRKIVGLYGL